MAAGASALLGVFSFTLPPTPPIKKAGPATMGEMMGLEAIGLLKNRSYLIFFLASVAICVPLSFYYGFTNPFLNEMGMKSAAGVQSLGQVSEVLFMLLIPVFFVRLGVKKMLAIGMLAWVVRYAVFRLRQRRFGLLDADCGHCAARHLLRFLLRDGPDLHR